ncbi:MAG TPA: hypothetical protein VFZ83_03205 [Acidimicrobiia bacterium]|nr:hypothetical protein [Acidimicrobiia bacterium]
MASDVSSLRRIIIPMALIGFTAMAALGSWLLVRSVDDAIYARSEWAADVEADPGFSHRPAGTTDVGPPELRDCDSLDAGEVNPMLRRTIRAADPDAAITSFATELEAAGWTDQQLDDPSVAAFEREFGPSDDVHRTFVRVRPGESTTEVLVEAIDIDETCSTSD